MVDALKEVRRQNREQEIALHGHSISKPLVIKPKTIYTRKVKHKKSDI